MTRRKRAGFAGRIDKLTGSLGIRRGTDPLGHEEIEADHRRVVPGLGSLFHLSEALLCLGPHGCFGRKEAHFSIVNELNSSRIPLLGSTLHPRIKGQLIPQRIIDNGHRRTEIVYIRLYLGIQALKERIVARLRLLRGGNRRRYGRIPGRRNKRLPGAHKAGLTGHDGQLCR